MQCGKCYETKQQHMVYAVNWQTWRQNRIQEWKAQRKTNVLKNESKKIFKQHTNGGYIGYICHDCNKLMNARERETLDGIIIRVENIESGINGHKNTLQ